jgi:hypothetical protein
MTHLSFSSAENQNGHDPNTDIENHATVETSLGLRKIQAEPSPLPPRSHLPFGYAVMMMAEGKGPSRTAWPKPAFVHLQKGKLAPEKIEAPKEGEEKKEHMPRTSVDGIPLHLFEAIEEGNTASPVFMRKTADDTTIYNPTHEDLLAEDWYVVTQ